MTKILILVRRVSWWALLKCEHLNTINTTSTFVYQLSWGLSTCHWKPVTFRLLWKLLFYLHYLRKPTLIMKFLQTTDLFQTSRWSQKLLKRSSQYVLEANQLNEPLQSAYKPFHSCETTLVLVHNDILVAIDERCCVMLLLSDLSAAFFDTVDHDILHTRLNCTLNTLSLA